MCWPAIVAAAVACHGCSHWSACGEQPTTLPVCGEVWVLAAVLVAVAAAVACHGCSYWSACGEVWVLAAAVLVAVDVLVLLSLMVVATVVAVKTC